MEKHKQKTIRNASAQGKLYICATPIGNLEDVSYRLLRTLKETDIIVAEDTRKIRKILSKYSIRKSGERIISYQDHSDEKKTDHIIDNLREGHNVALVSESGLPVIQDPGFRIVRKCIDSGIEVTVVPGPNAALSALVLSGIAPDSFVFIGFLPKTSSKRKDRLTEVAFLPFTLIFYESPKRIGRLLEELLETIGERQACLVREMTKVYEEVIRGSISEIIDWVGDRNIRGEIVLVIEGYKKQPVKDYTEKDIEKEMVKLLARNIPKKEVLKILQSRYDIGRQKLYNMATRF